MGRLSLETIAPEAKERHLPVRRQLLFFTTSIRSQ